ncbi:hypothetical protein IC762_21585 [Bradyrhizobium genosp. L]|nr:hypothetical protein IC762_21585 [Bradyrhizobium genosp. L]
MLYADDLAEGQTFQLGSYTISEAEILEFAGQYDPIPIHTDPVAAAAGPFGLWHCARGRQGAATGGEALRAVSGISRSRARRRPRSHHDPSCAVDDARARLG